MESRHGDPETWGNPRRVAENNLLFCDFHFSLCLTFLKLSFLRNTGFRRTDWGYISRKCRAITKENKFSRKRACSRWEVVYTQGLLFSVSQMKCPCIVLRTLRNKQIIKLQSPFVCFETSVMLAASLMFDVSKCRIHLGSAEKFQSVSHFRYWDGIYALDSSIAKIYCCGNLVVVLFPFFRGSMDVPKLDN